MKRREFAKLIATAGVATALPSLATGAEDAGLQSELLFDLVFDKGPVNSIDAAGSRRVVVSVLGGSFEGPKLKGTIGGPAGDWMSARADARRFSICGWLLQTDDAQKINMNCRGVAYTPQGGALYARILPMFETGAAKYAWMNNIVAAGVYRPMPNKVAYRVYQIL